MRRDIDRERRAVGAVRPHARIRALPDLLASALVLAAAPGPARPAVRELAEGCRGDDAALVEARSRCLELLAEAPGDERARRALKLLSMALHPSAAAWRGAARRAAEPVAARPAQLPRVCSGRSDR